MKNVKKIANEIVKKYMPGVQILADFSGNDFLIEENQENREAIGKIISEIMEDFKKKLRPLGKFKRKSNLKEEIIEFFKENPNPLDEQVHEWAEENGYDKHEVENKIYEIATEHVKKHLT